MARDYTLATKTTPQPRNAFELAGYKQLTRNKAKFKYEGERISWLITGHYKPDFSAEKKDGDIMRIEYKGYLRPDHKRVMVAVKKLHPAIDLRIVFYRNDAKNIKWAEKNKIPWAVGKIPKEWIDELR